MVGLLVVIVIIAALAYGSSFFWKKNNTDLRIDTNDANNIDTDSPVGAIKALNQAKGDIDEINSQIADSIDSAQDRHGPQIASQGEETAVTDSKTIEVTSIKAGDDLASPVAVEGTGMAKDNILNVELRNSEHETMVKEPVTIKAAPGASGPFKITLSFEFGNTKEGFVAVYEPGDNGQESNLIEIPVTFNANE